MDVVRKNIEALRGNIDIESTPGKGSKIILRIPLTLAILDAMIVRVGTARYAIPIAAIRQSFRPQTDVVSRTMDGLEMVQMHDEIIPVVRLHELFHREPDTTNLHEGTLIMLHSRMQTACLFVDEIVGQQQAVVKGLSDFIGKVQGIMGCLVLGDGDIGLILDVESLLTMHTEELEV
jgi:two-component system chemotaxis sensor kinase CheA